jgi:hypothetical protein
VYFIAVILLLLIFPVASVLTESALSGYTANILGLTGKWFVFWAAGVRLFTAGLRQVVQPKFTAEEIFAIHDLGSFAIVRELGFANLSMGLLGICTIFRSARSSAASTTDSPEPATSSIPAETRRNTPP